MASFTVFKLEGHLHVSNVAIFLELGLSRRGDGPRRAILRLQRFRSIAQSLGLPVRGLLAIALNVGKLRILRFMLRLELHQVSVITLARGFKGSFRGLALPQSLGFCQTVLLAETHGALSLVNLVDAGTHDHSRVRLRALARKLR